MEDVVKEANKHWGSIDHACPTNNESIIQERTIRMAIGNWVSDSLLEDDLSSIELRRQLHACCRSE